MRQAVWWTNWSLRQLSRRRIAMGTPASRRTIRRLLRQHQWGLRTARKQKTMGHHPDRNAPFEKIARRRREYQDAGEPVISSDPKQQELLGNFRRDGQTDTAQTLESFDHDFARAGPGKWMRHGLDDLTRQQGHLNRNTSHDSSALCCDRVAPWWQEHGRTAQRHATRMLRWCDGGGSHSATPYRFQEDLQRLANRLGLELRVPHYPP